MKKIIAFVLCSLLLTAMVVPAVSAEYSHAAEYFDDGSYIVVTYVKPDIESDNDGTEGDWEDIFAEESANTSFFDRIIKWVKDIFSKLFAKKSTVTKTKYCNYFDSNGKLLWSVCLKGTFTYNHRKALCVSNEISYEIRDSDWRMLSYTSTEEENMAKGEFSIRQYKLGVPLKLVEKELILTCDKDGNVK